MIVTEKFYVGFKDIKENLDIKNASLLTFLENIAGIHANSVGDGFRETINTTHTTWLLLSWKVKILKSPSFGEKVEVSTWVRETKRIYSKREFEVKSEAGEMLAVASSVWVRINVEKKMPESCSLQLSQKYGVCEKTNFPEDKMINLKEPENVYSKKEFTVNEFLIDMNYHMNNTHYVTLAELALGNSLPKSIKGFEVMYKKEIKKADKIKCLCGKEDGNLTVAIKSFDENTLHAIIKFYL
ncbi:MAG: hypothetical protein IJC89_05360 [Clostridia bacterium]|nr:hypothetical protein [Clostridia bacterium]